MINIDELYKQVENSQITSDELYDIIDIMANGTSFNNSNYDELDLFIKIAETKLVPDSKIVQMFNVFWINNPTGTMEFTKLALLLDGGSKASFDKIWESQPKIRYYIFESIWCDATQLHNYYYSEVDMKKSGAMGTTWVKRTTTRVVMHQNCPSSIILNLLKKYDATYILDVVKKPILPDDIFYSVSYFISMRDDTGIIFKTFIEYSKMPWDKIAECINFDTIFDENNYKKTIKYAKKHDYDTFYFFCQRDDAPSYVKMKWFEWTNDGNFLPKDAKDIFVF